MAKVKHLVSDLKEMQKLGLTTTVDLSLLRRMRSTRQENGSAGFSMSFRRSPAGVSQEILRLNFPSFQQLPKNTNPKPLDTIVRSRQERSSQARPTDSMTHSRF
jgi:hypothetical protein